MEEIRSSHYERNLIALDFGSSNDTRSYTVSDTLINYRNGDADFWGAMFVWTILGFYIFLLFAHIFTSWGLWKLAKKFQEPFPWMAWIPCLNLYTMVKVAGKSWIWTVYLIIGFILYILPGLILVFFLSGSLARRLGRGIGTTILTFLFPYIMYPYLATRQDAVVSASIPNASASTLNFGSIGVTPLVTSDSISSGNATPSSSDVSSVSTSTSETSATSTDTSSGSTDGGSTTH